MSGYGLGKCQLEEFEWKKQHRSPEAVFATGAIFTLMLKLKKEKAFKAAKFPARIHEAFPVEEGIHRVNFDVLDEDLGTTVEANAFFADGFMMSESETLICIEDADAVLGFFSGNGLGDEVDGKLHALIKGDIKSEAA